MSLTHWMDHSRKCNASLCAGALSENKMSSSKIKKAKKQQAMFKNTR